MFALIDCNNFFASCERVFRPDLANKPVIVLSNNDGCVIARSNEAKTLGIPMGAPFFKIRDLVRLNNVAVFSSNFPLYGDFSHRVMDVIRSEVPQVEVYSIDEAFADFSFLPDEKACREFSTELQKKIVQYTGIPISIGLAETKTLAKLANQYAKKHLETNGIHLWREAENIFLFPQMSIGDVWGVGRRSVKNLAQDGIFTIEDFCARSDEWIRENYHITGYRMKKELEGTSCMELEDLVTPRKNILASRSFRQAVNKYAHLSEAVSTFVSRAAEKLRSQNSVVREMTVFIYGNRFADREKRSYGASTVLLPVATDHTPTLIKFAKKILKEIYDSKGSYHKAGVVFSHLTSKKIIQENLFEISIDRKKQRNLMQVIDEINREQRSQTLFFAAQGTTRPWSGKQEHRSPRYTTEFREILKIKV